MIRLAVVGLDAARLQAIAPRLRGAMLHAFDAPKSGDAIAFLGTPSAEGPAIERALFAGAHVLVAVDTSPTRDGLHEWQGLAHQNNVRLVLVNLDRYRPALQLIRRQLDAGKLGTPGLIRVHRWQATECLLNDLDLVLWYFGSPANVVYAIENDGCTQVHLGFPEGGMALLDCAKRLPAGDRYFSFSIIGSSGAAYADDHANVQLVYKGGSASAVRAEEGVGNWATLLQEFIDGVEHESWEQVLTVNEAVAQSLRTKRAVAIAGAFLT